MANKTKTKLAKYLPKIISKSVTGRVAKNSIVPVCCSSAKVHIVMAGIRNIKILGAKPKKKSKVANPESNKFVSGKTHKNNPIVIKNTPITI